jgi:hypothetical protein
MRNANFLKTLSVRVTRDSFVSGIKIGTAGDSRGYKGTKLCRQELWIIY